MNYRKVRYYESDVHVIEYDPRTTPSQLCTGKAGREPLSQIEHGWYNDHGYQAKAKINFGFFDFSQPVEHYGMFIHDGGIVSGGTGGPTTYNGIEAYLTWDYKFVVRDVADGEVADLEKNVFWGATLSYALVINGQKNLAKSQFYAHSAMRFARTMIGQKANGMMVLAVADGGGGYDKGLDANQEADVMIALGCVNAANCDGGGSSEIIYDGKLKNSPSDGSERRIGSALLVFDKVAVDTPVPDPHPGISLSPNFYLNRFIKGQNGKPDVQGKPEIIVIHLTQGAYSSALSWLCNKDSEASANLLARKDGHLERLVRDEDGPWTNGRISVKPGVPTNPIIKKYLDNHWNPNLFSLTIEVEWFVTEGVIPVGSPLYNALVKQVSDWCDQYNLPKDATHIIGHYVVDPIGKPYCGKHIPWESFIPDVQKYGTVDPDGNKPKEERIVRVYFDNKQQAAFGLVKNAFDYGWTMYNAGHKDCYLIDSNPAEGLYTFDKHPDENPSKPKPVYVTLTTGVLLKEIADQLSAEIQAKYSVTVSTSVVDPGRK